MKSGNRDLVDRLAGEYALGTLRGSARRHFERWLRSSQVRHMVHDWEDRLASFEPAAQAVAPPPEVWERLEQRLELRDRGPPPALVWSGLIVLVGALAVAVLWLAKG